MLAGALLLWSSASYASIEGVYCGATDGVVVIFDDEYVDLILDCDDAVRFAHEAMEELRKARIPRPRHWKVIFAEERLLLGRNRGWTAVKTREIWVIARRPCTLLHEFRHASEYDRHIPTADHRAWHKDFWEREKAYCQEDPSWTPQRVTQPALHRK
jgi:hypothetical protein